MEKPLLLLATSGVHSDQLQPLLLDVLAAGDVVMVFILKIQGVWRGEWRGGAGKGLGATSAVPMSLGELAHFVGLVGSSRVLLGFSTPASQGDLQDLVVPSLWPISNAAGASHKGLELQCGGHISHFAKESW